MNINLREDETNLYVSFYQDYLEEVQCLNKKVTDVLNKVMQESKYDKLQQRISKIIDTYTETIVNNIGNGVFAKWVESTSSLRLCLKTYRAGDEADEVCAQIEQNMGDLIQNILKIEKAELIITERPIVSEEGLEQLEYVCQNAQTEIQDIKSNYISKVESKSEENEIYGTLKPLFENIAVNMEAFFKTSLNSFVELHDFVREIAVQLYSIADENVVATNTESGINKKLASRLSAIASTMNNASESLSVDKFKELTNLLYNTIYEEATRKKKKLSYESIALIMPIYHKFYSEYGNILKDKFDSFDEKEKFIKQEYFDVTRERENEQYFDGEEIKTFKSNACYTYTVFDRVADMERNIANSCKDGSANDINLLYGAYVLFTPIIEGHINEEDSKEYSKFSKWAANEILSILGMEINNSESDDGNVQEIEFNGENFNDENIKLFVNVVEQIVNQAGVDELSSWVDKHYSMLVSSRKIYSRKAKCSSASEYNINPDVYGRYTVTRKSIQMMAPVCKQANIILDPIDKFYKEKFESLGNGFVKANATIHTLSSFLSLWGFGALNLSGLLFSTTDQDSPILTRIKLGGLSLTSCTAAGKIINGGACMLKIIDWAMPHIKKSKILVKLSEKVWDLTRQDIQIPYVQKMMDQYIMEHYELEYGMNKGQSPYFEYYHNVATEIKDNHQRRTFENSVFAADTILIPQNYTINEVNPKKYREICCGIFLNLVRSGMCNKQDIESKTANDIVDKLYNIYVSKENVIPRVDISPDKRVLK